MASTREIRRRIKSVANIEQVTRAMEAVAASRMRRAQQMVTAARPFSEKAFDVLHYIARLPVVEADLSELMTPRPVRKGCVVLVSGDRGLAGGFNANVIRKGQQEVAALRAENREVCAIPIGRKGRDWFQRYDPVIHAEFNGHPDPTRDSDIAGIRWSSTTSGRAFDECGGLHRLCEHPGADSNRGQAAGWNRPSRACRGTGLHLRAGSADGAGTGHLRVHRGQILRRSTNRWPASTRPAWWPCATPRRQPRNCWRS